MKIVINNCFGGWEASEELFRELDIPWDNCGHLGNKDFGISSSNCYQYRLNQELIKAIEKIGETAASGVCAELLIVEIPDGVNWEIQEYDGWESIHEVHRSWP